MDIGQAIWIFFLMTALQPVVKQRLLESSRLRLLAQIERRRESRVILLVHRQETMSLLGFPLMRYIDVNDAENVMRACEMTDPEVPLDLVLHTPGGLVLGVPADCPRRAQPQGQGDRVRASLRDVRRDADRVGGR